MVKNKQNKPRNREHVRVNSKFTSTQSLNPSTAVTNLGAVTCDASGIWSTCQNITNLADMFRLFKIENVTFEFGPMTATGSAGVNVPAGMLFFKYEGVNAPSTLTDIEQPTVSNVSSPWGGLSVAGAESLARETITRLGLANKDMPILQGPSSPGDAGFLVTQDDGTQTSFGSLFWCFLTTAASSTLTYYLRSYFDIIFKDILDPSTISKDQLQRQKRAVEYHVTQQSGHAPHVVFEPGVLEKFILLHIKVPSMIPAASISTSDASEIVSPEARLQALKYLKQELKALEEG